MRIAQVAPLFESVPPPLYGGTERVVSYLTEELVRLGHEVTLFAQRRLADDRRLVAACPTRAVARSGLFARHCRSTSGWSSSCSSRRARFDIIHFHLDYLHFPLVRRHRCADRDHAARPASRARRAGAVRGYRDVPLVSISDNQRTPVPSASWQATVYHGLPRTLFHAQRRRAATISPSSDACRRRRASIAPSRSPRAAGVPLTIAAKIYPEERAYFDATDRAAARRVERRWFDFVGEVGGRDKEEFLGKRARAAVPDRMGRAVRAGDDRVAGLRHAGHRLAQGIGSGNHRGRRDRFHRGERRGRGPAVQDSTTIDRRHVGRRLRRVSTRTAWPANT